MTQSNIILQNTSLSDLTQVLASWIGCIEHYIEIWDGTDLPYWYNERGNVSVLAGAAWRAGWVAIEEYQMKKSGKNREQLSGRNDLSIANAEHDFCIEAKVVYMNLKETNRHNDLITEAVDRAVNDAKAMTCDSRRIAAIFVIPYTRIGELEPLDLEQFIEILEGRNDDALAWVTPNLSSPPISHDNRIYPLASLIIKEVMRTPDTNGA